MEEKGSRFHHTSTSSTNENCSYRYFFVVGSFKSQWKSMQSWFYTYTIIFGHWTEVDHIKSLNATFSVLYGIKK